MGIGGAKPLREFCWSVRPSGSAKLSIAPDDDDPGLENIDPGGGFEFGSITFLAALATAVGGDESIFSKCPLSNEEAGNCGDGCCCSGLLIESAKI